VVIVVPIVVLVVVLVVVVIVMLYLVHRYKNKGRLNLKEPDYKGVAFNADLSSQFDSSNADDIARAVEGVNTFLIDIVLFIVEWFEWILNKAKKC
jgi:hypothetical protein